MTEHLTSPADDPAQDIPGSRTLLRGLDLLFAIGNAPQPLRFSEMQEQLGIPKGTLHRLLAALQSRDLLRYDPKDRSYGLGSKVLELARRTLDQSTEIRAAKPELSRLSRQVGRASCLYVPDGDEVFVLDFEDPDAAHARVVRVWPRLSAETSAPGIALASRRQAVEKTSSEIPPVVSQARALGYAITGGEMPAVAAPVLDSTGRAVAALCCHFDQSAMAPDTLHETGRAVREAAQRASGNVALSRTSLLIAPRPDKTSASVTVHNTGRDFMGENPVWCDRTGGLWWLDILAPALRWRSDATGETRRILLDDLTGGLALTESGKLLLAGRTGIYLFDTEAGRQSLLFDPEENLPDNRFNSATVASDGALWIGTMPVDNGPGPGSLYRLSPDLTVTVALAEVGLPKNSVLSSSGNSLYISEGRDGCLRRYPVDKDGRLGSPTTIVTGRLETGTPNGIALDEEDCIWVAMLGGWSVNRYDPDGSLLASVTLPVPMPTALAFGGPNRDRLFVTSTYLRMPAGYSGIAPQAGNLIEIDAGVRGCATHRFAL